MCFKKKEKYQLTYESMKKVSYIMCFIFWAPYSDNIDLTEDEKEILYSIHNEMQKILNHYPKLGLGKYNAQILQKAYGSLWDFFKCHIEELGPFIERILFWNEVTENNNYACAAITDARAIGLNYLEEEEKLSSTN